MSAYTINLENAAERHYSAGEHLYSDTHRKDVAGYLYGIAAECAVKELMRRSGIRQLENRRDDPFFAHFPDLKTLLRNRIQGRNSQVILRFIADSFMQEWDVAMRYAPSGDIAPPKVERWREQAKQAINAMKSN